MEADRYGHCCICHRSMIYEQVVGQKVITRFSADYSEVEYLLSNFTKMRVAICVGCKSTLTDNDKDRVMECVIEGWKKEVEDLQWSEEKKKDYLDKYSKLKIICQSDNVPNDILKQRYEEYNKEVENVNHR